MLAARRLLERAPLWGWAILVLAAVISYSCIYAGLHYPTDVAAGALPGLACGWIGARWATRQDRQEKHREPGHPKQAGDAREEPSELEYQQGG